MKTLAIVLCAATELTALAQSPFTGTWQAKANGLPAVTLVVQDEGRLTGTIVFYLQKRDAVGTPWRVEGGAIQALAAPRADGTRLTFEVRRGDAPVTMTVEFTGPDEARLGDVVLTREQ